MILTGCADADAAPTKLTTNNISVAAPAHPVNLASGVCIDGTATSLARSDFTCGVTGVLPKANGGLGTSSCTMDFSGGNTLKSASTAGLTLKGDLAAASPAAAVTIKNNVVMNPGGLILEVPDLNGGFFRFFVDGSLVLEGVNQGGAVHFGNGSSIIETADGAFTLQSGTDGNVIVTATGGGTLQLTTGSGGLLSLAGAVSLLAETDTNASFGSSGNGHTDIYAGDNGVNFKGSNATINRLADIPTAGGGGSAGVAGVYALYTTLDETASKGDTTLWTVAGPGTITRVSVYVRSSNTCATPGPAGVTVGLKWTDDSTVQKSLAAIPMMVNGSTTLATSLPLGNTTGWSVATFAADIQPSTNVIFNTTMTACTSGTAKYRIKISVERI